MRPERPLVNDTDWTDPDKRGKRYLRRQHLLELGGAVCATGPETELRPR